MAITVKTLTLIESDDWEAQNEKRMKVKINNNKNTPPFQIDFKNA